MIGRIQFIKPKFPPLTTLYRDFQKIYKSGIFTNSGPFERELEKRCANYLKSLTKDSIYTIAVSNATIGLTIAAKILDPKSKTVILPSFTFAASIEAAMWAGLKPSFVDIEMKTWSMKLNNQIRKKISSGKVGLILFCNPFGIPGNIEEWEQLAKEYKVPILIDSAAGFGSVYSDGIKMGLKGIAEVFSLHATKTFAIGEGGLIVTKNKTLANKLQKTKNFGFDEKSVVKVFGTNAKLNEMSAAIGLQTLKNYNQVLKKKKEVLKHYQELMPPEIISHKDIALSALQFYPVLFPSRLARDRSETKLKKNGVQTRRYYYPPLHKHKIFSKVERLGNLSTTEDFVSRTLSLPLHLYMTKSDVQYIASLIAI